MTRIISLLLCTRKCYRSLEIATPDRMEYDSLKFEEKKKTGYRNSDKFWFEIIFIAANIKSSVSKKNIERFGVICLPDSRPKYRGRGFFRTSRMRYAEWAVLNLLWT